MGKFAFKLKRNKKQEEKAYKDEIECLKERITSLELRNEPIGFADAQVYCVDCGNIEHYNFYKPFAAPSKCSKCGGRMTDEQTEKLFKSLEIHLKKAKKTIDNRRKAEIYEL